MPLSLDGGHRRGVLWEEALKESEMVRLFVAVEAGDQGVPHTISQVQHPLSKIDSRVTTTDPHQAHITLKFLGEVQRDRVKDVKERLGSITFSPFSFSLEKVGVFPSWKKPRVLWIGPRETPDEMTALHRRVEDEMATLGFEREKRSYSAHVTVGRIKQPWKAGNLRRMVEDLPSFSVPVEVKDFRLKKSVLTPQGPEYDDVFVQSAEAE